MALFSDPTFWVAVAFVLFFALLGKAPVAPIAGMLDKRAAGIAKALADAERLRADALKAKPDAEATLARRPARPTPSASWRARKRTACRPAPPGKLETAVALREQQAKDRIAQAEAAATKEVRDTAVDVALAATRALLQDQVARAALRRWSTRRSPSCRAACTRSPNLNSTRTTIAGTWRPRRKAGVFLCMSSPVGRGGGRSDKTS